MNGALRVASTVHTGDIRENDVLGDGTVYASDNPGFAGSGFVFEDELLFDITGPLRRWNGTNWSTANISGEEMQFVEPGPFGEPLNSVVIGKETRFQTGYLIARIGTRGNLHTHFVFILRRSPGTRPDVGAYTFPLTLRSPRYAPAPPVHLVFNNGLTTADFEIAVDRFRSAQEARMAVAGSPDGTVSLIWNTVEGRTTQIESAPTPNGPWTAQGEPVGGDGGMKRLTVATVETNRFFRLRTP
jgi:hypothetical protein